MERTHEQERTKFVQDRRNRSGDDCIRIGTRRLCQNRAAVQIGAATRMMNGCWIAVAGLGNRRAIVIGAELASRCAVEVHHH